ncbi:MAG: class I SAM-dependent methyltransferase [Cyclobacteriaceae bacterium]|nr:class I SAM-dependent methyltransferase [Cyclobacteriaceae bacterium]
MSRLFPIQSYLRHWLNAVDEHSIHSPYFFELYLSLLKSDWVPDQAADYEKLRQHLLGQSLEVTVTDYGSGAKGDGTHKRILSEIAATSLAPAKWAGLYARIIRRCEPAVAIELGTSLGVTSLYLGARKATRVFTFEGSPGTAQIALTNFESLEASNISLVEGPIEETLPDFLQNHRRIDFALLDANHRYAPTRQYFEWLAHRATDKSVFIVDDIYRSAEMARAWDEIRLHPLVYGSVDLFRCGLVFFDPALNRQHFRWSY